MGEKHWTKEEKECLMNYILPLSMYSKWYLDADSGGMSWKELAKVMQAKMKEDGVEIRKYTETNTFQKYYQTLSRAGMQGRTGPSVKLSKKKLEEVKRLRAWLAREYPDEFDGEEEEDSERGEVEERGEEEEQAGEEEQATQPGDENPVQYNRPYSPQEDQPVKHDLIPYHLRPEHYTREKVLSSKKNKKRTSHFHPFPQLSPGGTMRRIYDDEDVCPPEQPNYLSIYGARKEADFSIPYFPEENIFTHVEKERIEKRTAEYERTRARADQEEQDDEDEEGDEYPTSFPPAKRIRNYSPVTIIKKTPTKPTAKKPSAKVPSASKTQKTTPAKHRASAPVDVEDSEDDDVDESSDEDIDPRVLGDGGDSPVGVPRFDVHEAATRPLTRPKQYKAGTKPWTWKQYDDMYSLPRFKGGFIDPAKEVAAWGVDKKGGPIKPKENVVAGGSDDDEGMASGAAKDWTDDLAEVAER